MKKTPLDKICDLLPALSINEMLHLHQTLARALVDKSIFRARLRVIQHVQDHYKATKSTAGKRELKQLLRSFK